MDQPLLLSPASIYHLQKVAHRMHLLTGKRFRLSEEPSLVHLLQLAARARDEGVQQSLRDFIAQLDRPALKALAHRGVPLIAEDHAPSASGRPLHHAA